jgi:hypothetical protein
LDRLDQRRERVVFVVQCIIDEDQIRHRVSTRVLTNFVQHCCKWTTLAGHSRRRDRKPPRLRESLIREVGYESMPEVRWIELALYAQRVNVVICIDRKHQRRRSIRGTPKDVRLRDASKCDQLRKFARRKFNHADRIAASTEPCDNTRRGKRWKLRRLAHHGNECALAHARSSTGP